MEIAFWYANWTMKLMLWFYVSIPLTFNIVSLTIVRKGSVFLTCFKTMLLQSFEIDFRDCYQRDFIWRYWFFWKENYEEGTSQRKEMERNPLKKMKHNNLLPSVRKEAELCSRYQTHFSLTSYIAECIIQKSPFFIYVDEKNCWEFQGVMQDSD